MARCVFTLTTFKRNFPIHKLFERCCELGLWRLSADKIAEIFGTRLNRKMPGKLTTVIDRIEHGHHVFRACFKNALLKTVRKFSTFLRIVAPELQAFEHAIFDRECPGRC